jgi:hypothetical protein
MNRRLDRELSGSSDSYIQITQYHPECGVFSTGWSGGASVYNIGALSGFLGSTTILGAVRHRMIRCFAGGDHRFIRRYYFFRKNFLTASLPCLAYKYDPPASLELSLPFWRSIAAKERRRVCSCNLGFSSSCLRAIFLSDQEFSRCIHGFAECLGQVKVCGLVTLGVWRLLDGLGV